MSLVSIRSSPLGSSDRESPGQVKRELRSDHRRSMLRRFVLEIELAGTGSAETILGLATVTGSPCETLILGRSENPDDKTVDRDHLWMKLCHARTMNFLMCAMCSNKQIDKRDFDQCGLLNIHAYSLQDLKESIDGKHRLIKLRNPWGGTHRWKGLFSSMSIAI